VTSTGFAYPFSAIAPSITFENEVMPYLTTGPVP
jgi:hypothetical protein